MEGIEASGKTTLAHGLQERLLADGIEPLMTREPGGTTVGDRLRALLLNGPGSLDPVTELFIVCAARAEHVASVIAPALAARRFVLCDRYSDATRAYQGGGRGLDDAMVATACHYAERGVRPHLTLLVDVPPEISRERVAARTHESGVPQDRLERENDVFHVRVRERYLQIARDEPDRVKILDGTQSPAAVAEAGWAQLAPLIGRA